MATYEVIRPIVHEGRSYGPGETLSLTKIEARWLKAGGQVRRAKKKKTSRRSKPKPAKPAIKKAEEKAPEPGEKQEEIDA